ncbi:hypothetical protein [Paenibacillus allorhizoplanae]|nr:hypothetical protein [Paenibacillus allorhizoplanae]
MKRAGGNPFILQMSSKMRKFDTGNPFIFVELVDDASGRVVVEYR